MSPAVRRQFICREKKVAQDYKYILQIVNRTLCNFHNSKRRQDNDRYTKEWDKSCTETSDSSSWKFCLITASRSAAQGNNETEWEDVSLTLFEHAGMMIWQGNRNTLCSRTFHRFFLEETAQFSASASHCAVGKRNTRRKLWKALTKANYKESSSTPMWSNTQKWATSCRVHHVLLFTSFLVNQLLQTKRAFWFDRKLDNVRHIKQQIFPLTFLKVLPSNMLNLIIYSLKVKTPLFSYAADHYKHEDMEVT